MKDDGAQKLDKFGKRNVFKMPEGYFDSLEERISNRINIEEEKKVIALKSLVRWKWVAAAAAATAILILSVSQLFQSGASSVDDMLAEIPADQCLAYLKQSDLDMVDFLAVDDLGSLLGEGDELLFREDGLGDGDVDLLYERYGVTDDKKLQTL